VIGSDGHWVCGWVGGFFSGAEQAAEKGLIPGEMWQKRTTGTEVSADSIGFIPGMNPRPTARVSFSAACEARGDFVDSSGG